MEPNYYDYMRVEDLKNILDKLPDDMLVIIPVVDKDDVNSIRGFRKVRTAGILKDDGETEGEREVFCLNGATSGYDIAEQIHVSGRDVSVSKVLYGNFDKEKTDENR